MKKMELFNKGIHRISQQIKQLFKVSQSIQLQTIVSIFALLLFSSCKEYIAVSAALVFLPEMLFGIIMVVLFIIAIIGGIIHFLTGGDK